MPLAKPISKLIVNRDHLNELTDRREQLSTLSAPISRGIQIVSFMNLSDTPMVIYAKYLVHTVN